MQTLEKLIADQSSIIKDQTELVGNQSKVIEEQKEHISNQSSRLAEVENYINVLEVNRTGNKKIQAFRTLSSHNFLSIIKSLL